MFASLRSRLWLTHMLVAGVVTLVAGLAVFVYVVNNPAVDRREIQRLRLLAGLVARRSPILTQSQGEIPPERLQEALQRADNTSAARYAIFDSTGNLLADSRAGKATPLPDWSEISGRQVDDLQSYRDVQGRRWLYVLAPLENGQTLVVATIRPRLPVVEILRDEFLGPLVRALLLALLLSFLLAFWISRWVSASLDRLVDGARSVAQGQFRKIPLAGPSEVRSVAAAFNDMTERVQSSQRSQRDFVANVSHDLKTPLTSIQGFAQAILDGMADNPAAARQSAQIIYDESERMRLMVVDLLELARLDAGTMSFEMASLDLGGLLQQVVGRFSQAAATAGVGLTFTPPPPLPVITGDAERLGQVFSNLLENAIKYTPAGGQVRVDVCQLPDGQVEIQVADTGSGIPAEEQERIFERFYQTDKARRGGKRRGVGLGLAIARDIVQAHGGSILAQNRHPETGSVFIVRLPAANPNNGQPTRRSRPDGRG